jgi:hypothetical protein
MNAICSQTFRAIVSLPSDLRKSRITASKKNTAIATKTSPMVEGVSLLEMSNINMTKTDEFSAGAAPGLRSLYFGGVCSSHEKNQAVDKIREHSLASA